MTALETEYKHLATKADLEKGLSGLRLELHATELRLSKQVQKVRKEAQKNREELQAEIRRMPYVILVGLAALATVASIAPQAIDWLRGLLG